MIKPHVKCVGCKQQVCFICHYKRYHYTSGGMCRRRKPHENADDYQRNENIVEPPTWETTASEDSWDYDDVEPY